MAGDSDIARQIDERSKEFLQLLKDRDGPTSTSKIRAETGLSNAQVRHRRNKLEELGLIDVDDGHTTTDRTPPKVHTLTEKGEHMIENGLLGEVDLPRPGTMNEVVDRLEYLENRVTEQERRLRETRDGVRKLKANLERRLGGGEMDMASSIREFREQLEEIESTLDDHDERIENKKDRSTLL